MEAWSGIQLTAVAAAGDLQQIFPTWTPNGQTSLQNRTPGQTVRRPTQGTLHSIQIRTDGANGGTIEIWDVSGEDIPVDVSTPSTPTFTNAQLTALQARGLAKLIYAQDFVANSGAATPSAPPRSFLRGLAARFINGGPAGTCQLNLVVEGGFLLIV
jgi:hypothetical protein